MDRLIAVLTSSDASSAGLRADTSGEILRTGLSALGTIVDYRVLADERPALEAALTAWIARGVDLVATTGGTGLGPRDVMPEATRAVIDREVPGISETMRRVSTEFTPFGMLSRGIVGIAGHTLIINFPGSPKACEQLLPVVLPVLPHALDVLAGRTQHEKS